MRRLMAALADQVSVCNGRLIYDFTGPPTRAIALSADNEDLLTDGLQAAASWVFTEGRDADTRHLLLRKRICEGVSAGAASAAPN